MKKLFLVWYLSVITIAVSSFDTTAQNYYKPDKFRDIHINENDKSIDAQVIVNKRINTKPDRFYSWYDNVHIHHTQGSYSKYLLSGFYTEYYPSKNMAIKGLYKNGLKKGEWYAWSPTGVLIEVSNWGKGLREGNTYTYNESGHVDTIYKYRKNKLIEIKLPHTSIDSLANDKQSFNQNIGRFWQGVMSIFKWSRKAKDKENA